MPFDERLTGGREPRYKRYLDLDNFPKSLSIVDKLHSDIAKAQQQGFRDAANAIREKLLKLLDKYELSSLKPFVNVRFYKNSFEITVNSQQAVFAEYGTGIMGEKFPHPDDPWQYDINGHGEKGWYAPIDELGVFPENQYKFITANGEYSFTFGMPSNPYFYELGKWIQSYGVVSRSINKRLRGLK